MSNEFKNNPNWVRLYDDKTGFHYFLNKFTNESLWDESEFDKKEYVLPKQKRIFKGATKFAKNVHDPFSYINRPRTLPSLPEKKNNFKQLDPFYVHTKEKDKNEKANINENIFNDFNQEKNVSELTQLEILSSFDPLHKSKTVTNELNILNDVCINENKTTSKIEIKEELPTQIKQHKTEYDRKWHCSSCSYLNHSLDINCKMCNKRREMNGIVDFIPSDEFQGILPGMCYKYGEKGIGYYSLKIDVNDKQEKNIENISEKKENEELLKTILKQEDKEELLKTRVKREDSVNVIENYVVENLELEQVEDSESIKIEEELIYEKYDGDMSGNILIRVTSKKIFSKWSPRYFLIKNKKLILWKTENHYISGLKPEKTISLENKSFTEIVKYNNKTDIWEFKIYKNLNKIVVCAMIGCISKTYLEEFYEHCKK